MINPCAISIGRRCDWYFQGPREWRIACGSIRCQTAFPKGDHSKDVQIRGLASWLDVLLRQLAAMNVEICWGSQASGSCTLRTIRCPVKPHTQALWGKAHGYLASAIRNHGPIESAIAYVGYHRGRNGGRSLNWPFEDISDDWKFLGACMATAGRIVFEGKVAVDIILAEDGKYYVDSTTTMDGEVVSAWTDGLRRRKNSAGQCRALRR